MNSLEYKKNELKKLCVLFAFKPLQVKAILENIDNYYGEWIEKKIDKKTGGYKTYADGTIKERIIRPSKGELKVIQSVIKNKILALIPLPGNIHGGVKKRSNITNAKPHQGNKYQFTTDLQEFYPNISAKNVYDTFIQLKFSPHSAHWLTALTTWKYQLPQGTPTSGHLANLVFLKTDARLIDLCNANNITYTRYVDDLTFSSQKNFDHLINDILSIILEGGFKISRRKTDYKGEQTVTGVQVLLNKIDAPDKIKLKAAEELANKSLTKPYSNYLNNIRKTNKRRSSVGKPSS